MTNQSISDTEGSREKALNIVMNQRIDAVRLSMNPPMIVKPRKNGRLEYEGKRYSVKRYESRVK